MSQIDIQKKGRVTLMKEEAYQMKIKLQGLRKSLLLALDELAHIEEVDAATISSQAVEFGACHTKYMELKKEITAAEKSVSGIIYTDKPTWP